MLLCDTGALVAAFNTSASIFEVAALDRRDFMVVARAICRRVSGCATTLIKASYLRRRA